MKNKRNKNFLTFNEARQFVRNQKLQSYDEWIKFASTNRPSNIPSNPQNIYKKEGWISYVDWIGNGKSPRKRYINLNFFSK